ncbi:MAG: hypothetical protein DCC67_04635 [Planctomycetota bacterium]|nr:MAG: hypothetical protein DCC67_04635 [Planctomycetota bacterium]
MEHGLLYGDRLLFFASRDAVLRFLDEPARYDDADLACDGRCAVSRIEGERDAPGIAETAVLHGGLRYLFASAFERSLFLQNPARYDGRGAEAVAPHPPTAARREPAPNATLKNPWRLPAGQGPGSSRATPEKEKFVLAAAPVMAGYCPVTIRRDGVWVRGRYDHRVELGEHLLLVAGPAERALFEADPAAYIPACLGDCPVTLVTRRERVRGSVFHALEYRGRLFLFADAQARAEFKASPDVYALADVAADGNCVVTQFDEQRAVPGLLHATAWHDGLLYRFAGDEQKRKFLAAPERYAAAVQPAADAGHQQPAVAQ